MTYKPRIGVKDQERYAYMGQVEGELRAAGFHAIAGLDEAGRGPLAGPVVAAACILDPDQPIYGLNDSKKLSPAKREWLAEEIQQKAKAFAIGLASPQRIDEINILEATKEAMTQAVISLDPSPDMLVLDAVVLKNLQLPQRSLVQGDAQVNCIAAASILAKTTRDKMMVEADQLYPGYGFDRHKGYGTKAHYEAIAQLGLCPLHRLSFLHKLHVGHSCPSADQVKGRTAEDRVAQHLTDQSFQILERNFSLPPFAEVDIIARKGGQLFFVEVKARQDHRDLPAQDQAIAAFHAEKQHKIALVAKYYAASRGWEKSKICLLLAACELNAQGEVEHIRYYEAD